LSATAELLVSLPKISLGTAYAIDFKFGVHVDHSISQPTDDKMSLKGTVT